MGSKESAKEECDVEDVGCRKNEDVEMDSRSYQAGQNKE